MLQTGWEETIVRCPIHLPSLEGEGCLLQMHPLDIAATPWKLEKGVTVIGRDEGCDICLADGSVSRRHAEVLRSEQGYRVVDLGSTNGTSVNERRVAESGLAAGDRLQVGGFILKFLSTNHIETQYHEAVYSMMTRDGLTGTLNKRSFLEILGREFRRAVHRGTALSLVLFDIDHFKQVNDTHGHLAGDEVLQGIGARVGSVIADHDVLARYGGEEFAILLPDVLAVEAVAVAERCRRAVEQALFSTISGPIPVTVSLGVADMGVLAQRREPHELIQAADERLYQAKRRGRNCVGR